MAEVVGLVAAVVQLATTAKVAVNLIEEVKNAPKARRSLRGEVEVLIELLGRLQARMQDSKNPDTSYQTYESVLPVSLVDGLRSALEELVAKTSVKSTSKTAEVGNIAKWTFGDKTRKDILERIGRFQALVQSLLASDQTDRLIRIEQNVIEVRDGVAQRTSEQIKEQRRRILDWLPSLESLNTHQAFIDQLLSGTGQWFLDSAEFEQWTEDPGEVLWCPGIPGAGKTIMSALVIEHLRQVCSEEDMEQVIWVYFNYKNQDRQNLQNLYGDLLLQLLRRRSDIPDQVRARIEEHQEQRTPLRAKDALHLLSETAKTCSRLFIVIDALDECSEALRSEFIVGLQSLGPDVNLLVTSRPLDEIGELFDEAITYRIVAHDSDITSYIEHQIDKNPRLAKSTRKDPSFAALINNEVREKSQQMFLLARLYMTMLGGNLSKNKIVEKLKCLPETLDAVYEEALGRIKQQSELAPLARQVLTWLAYANRPLNVDELHHALGVEEGVEEFDEDNLVIDVNDFTTSCVGLVVLDRSSRIIRFVHYTVQEYLRKHPEYLLPSPQTAMAKTCLIYLAYEDFLEKIPRNQMIEKYPFAAYAGRNWVMHMKGEPEVDLTVQELALSHLQKKERTTDTFLAQPIQADQYYVSFINPWTIRRGSSGIHIASGFGLSTLVAMLLERGEDPDMADDSGDAPLHFAAWNGQTEVIRVLLQNNADLHKRTTSNHCNALKCAVMGGREAAAKFLLEAGSDMYDDGEGMMCQPALNEAINFGQDNLFHLLLDRGADPDLRSLSHQKTPLLSACDHNRPDLARVLMERGAKLRRDDAKSALRHAIYENRHETLEFLVAYGADLNETLEGQRRSLDCALFARDPWTIDFLLCKNASTGLLWDSDRPLIQQWSQEAWFDKLVEMCIVQVDAQPSTSERLVATHETWEESGERRFIEAPYLPLRGLPVEFKWHDRSDEMAEAIRKDPDGGYIEVIIPDRFALVQRIIVTTESHDQGHNTLFSESHGTYNMSYTWFDILFQYKREKDQPWVQHSFQRNINASWDYKVHINTFDRSTSEPAIADAVWRLRGGDRIRIHAQACFKNRANHVRHVAVKVEGSEITEGGLDIVTVLRGVGLPV